MGRLDDITLEELHELKDQIDQGKPRERVLAAIGRKQGDQLQTLADCSIENGRQRGDSLISPGPSQL